VTWKNPSLLRNIIYRILLVGLFIIGGLTRVDAGQAQQTQPGGPVYVVTEGDSLWGIAARFGISVDDLEKANGISDPNQLKIGDRLTIPGLSGIEGVVVTDRVPYGETIRSLARRNNLPVDALVKLNRLTSPAELYAGAIMILPEPDPNAQAPARDSLESEQSLLELAVLRGANPWALVNSNALTGSWSALPGDVLRVPGVDPNGPGALPKEIEVSTIDPPALLQGKVAELFLASPSDLQLSGSLLGHDFKFYPTKGDEKVALQGVHAMTEPGIYPLDIQGVLPDGKPFSYEQMVRVKSVDYPYDRPLTVDPATIDPAVTQPEEAQWTALASTNSPEKYWNGIFQLPAAYDVNYCLQSGDCWSSRFGNRRSYNGGPYQFFHTGLDIVGKTGNDVYAAADGQVVFAGPLTVRGNATMIDHGHGVYTGYMHQSELLVKPGDMVKAGQLIGKVGATGRVQGPHLHWEVWVGGVQVDPLDWLEREYP
jgi:murein DD-endopeptidase MepM/ murein hydrolase activator NlpD